MKMTSLEMRATELITNLKIIIFNLLCKCSGPYFNYKTTAISFSPPVLHAGNRTANALLEDSPRCPQSQYS